MKKLTKSAMEESQESIRLRLDAYSSVLHLRLRKMIIIDAVTYDLNYHHQALTEKCKDGDIVYLYVHSRNAGYGSNSTLAGKFTLERGVWTIKPLPSI